MGRVYKALVKADKLKDGNRPIGRPANAANRPSTPAPASAPKTPGMGYIEKPEPIREQTEAIRPFEFHAQTSAVESFDPSPVVSFPKAVPTPAAPPAVQAPVFVEPRETVNVSALDIEPHLVTLNSGDLLACERYRTLAVRLLNMASRRKLKTLLITSALEGEGKTTVAANLAWVMAKPSERRVLLIDADLRRPSVARALGVETPGGWLDLLEGRADFEDVALRIDPNGLYMLSPVGSRQSQAVASDGTRSEFGQAEIADALTSSRVEKLLEDLEQRFDFVVIDAPPILAFADAQRLASVTDGTVLVARAARTHHNRVTDALKLVPKERRVGVVLNDALIDEELVYHNRKKRSGLGRLFGRKR